MGFTQQNAEAPKIFTFNDLTMTSEYALIKDSYPTISMPPVLTVVPAPKDYLNVTGAAVVELLRDGDQNIPVMFSASPSRVVINFGLAVLPAALAMINHNCFDVGDEIRIYSGASTPAGTLNHTIKKPDRSVDIFPLLRMNDAFMIPSTSTARQYWEIEFYKSGAVLPYCGEIFCALDYRINPYPVDDPGPDYANALALQRRASQQETMGGAKVNYDLAPFNFNIDLSASDKPEVDGSAFYELMTFPSEIVNRQTKASKTVLIYKQDRSAVFGRISDQQAVTYGEGKSSRSMSFIGELPNEFIID